MANNPVVKFEPCLVCPGRYKAQGEQCQAPANVADPKRFLLTVYKAYVTQATASELISGAENLAHNLNMWERAHSAGIIQGNLQPIIDLSGSMLYLHEWRLNELAEAGDEVAVTNWKTPAMMAEGGYYQNVLDTVKGKTYDQLVESLPWPVPQLEF